MQAFAAVALSAFTLATTAFAADAPLYGPEPAWVKLIPIPALKPDVPEPAVQIRLWDEQLRYGPDGRDGFTELAFRIGSATALAAAGNVVQSWDPQTQTLTIHHVRVLRGDKVIDALADGRRLTVLRRETNLESAMLDGRLTATLQLEGLQVGDVVDVSATLHDAEPVLQGKSEGIAAMAHAGEAKRMYLRELWPQATPLRWWVSDDLAPPTISRSGGWSELVYDLKDASTPPAPNGAPIRFEIRGLVEVSQFAAWSEVSALMAPLYAKAAQIAPSSSLHEAVARIRASSPDPRARALAALQLVENQVRYLFIGLNSGAYIPAPAETTWSRRYGDCKAKTALLLAVLHDLGVQAQPVLVSTVLGDGLDRRLPTLSVFDHVMVRATIEGQTYWLDGTRLDDQSLDDERSANFHWVLPVQTAGARLAAQTPLDPRDPLDERYVTLDASAGFDHPVDIHGERIYRGDTAGATHAQLQTLDTAEQDRKLRQLWSQDYVWANLERVSSTYDATHRTLHLFMDGAGPVSWFDEGGTRYLDLADTSLGWNASFRREPGQNPDAPYTVAYPSRTETHLTVVLPRKGQGTSLSNGGDLDETVAGVDYHRVARISDGRLEVASSSHSIAQEFPASEAVSAQAELQRLNLHDVMLSYPVALDPAPAMALSKTSPTMPGDAADVAYSGENHLGEKNYDAAIADFTKAMRLAPGVSKYAYDRGVAHYDAHQDDLAAADFDAALKIDSHDSFALNARGVLKLAHHDAAAARGDFEAALPYAADRAAALYRMGRVYESAQDYPDAVSVYDRWLRENPGAKAKPAVLNARCWARAEWGQDLPAALADCDASLKLAPNNAAVLDSRALVELRLGRIEAAIADSTAALGLSPGMPTSAYTRGLAEIRKGDTKAGSNDLKTATVLDPKVARAFSQMGLAQDPAKADAR